MRRVTSAHIMPTIVISTRVMGMLIFLFMSFVTVKNSPAPPILPPGPSSFQVTAYAYTPTSCSVTADDLTFPEYNYTTGVPQTSSASVTVNCSNGRGYALYPDNGQNLNVTRRMVYNGSNYLSYGLYKDSGFTQPWTMDVAGQLTGTGIGSVQNLNIYGYLPASQTAVDGVYLDTVTMIVEYTP